MAKGKLSANPTKPQLAAKVKNSFSKGGGLKQGKGGAKFVAGAKVGGGIAQNSVAAKLASQSKRGVKKANLSPISAQPKSPKNLKNTLNLSNGVKAPAKGGGFKAFIGGK